MRIRKGAAQIVTDLYRAYMDNPREMQSHYWVEKLDGMPESVKARHVGDYLAGMTDTYAISATGGCLTGLPICDRHGQERDAARLGGTMARVCNG